MRFFLQILSLSLLFTGCITKSANAKFTMNQSMASTLKPIQPVTFSSKEVNLENILVCNKDCNVTSLNKQEQIKCKDYILNHFLINSELSLYIKEKSSSVEVEYLNSGLSAKNSSYEITLDWTKSRIGRGVEDSTKLYKIGIGARIKINITTNEDNIDLSDIPGFGAKIANGDMYGSLHYSIIGISGEDVESTLPFVSKLDANSIAEITIAIQKIKLLS